MSETDQAAVNPEKLSAFMGRMLGDLGALTNSVLVHLGDQLGLYKALVKAGRDNADGAGQADRHDRATCARVVIRAGSAGLRHLRQDYRPVLALARAGHGVRP